MPPRPDLLSAAAEGLEARVARIHDLPTLPVVVAMALELLNSPEASLREVGELIATDQVLSARTLKVVNAPYFGLRRRLGSAVEAAVHLGHGGMRNLVVTSSITQGFAGSGRPQVPVRFWE